VLAFPINPADMWFCKGSYRLKPPLPATPGAECVGRVTAVGSAVKHVRTGDLVINLQRENWTQKRRVKGDDAIPLPAGIDLRQAAMVRINPPTARLMLADFVDLAGGEWVIQNVANSAVGRLLIVQAHQRGLRTVNVVRRAELADELKALGADVVLVDGPDLAARVHAATGGAKPRLGIDAVAGDATRRLCGAMADGGVVVNYGMLSGDACALEPGDVVFRDVSLRGFWLARWFASAPLDQQHALYRQLGAAIAEGALRVEVERVYPLAQAREALAHAARPGRSGKVLIAPNA
jgi:NADPH:quinone reductase-like Zn-dependent oxidoreductase